MNRAAETRSSWHRDCTIVSGYEGGVVRVLCQCSGHKVLDVWDEMALDGVAPNFYTILLSIEAATKSRRMGDLMSFWREMRRRGMRPNDMLYSLLIACCCRCGEAELGMKVGLLSCML